MGINFFKFRSPDFRLGKLLVLRKTVADSVRLMLAQRDAESVRFARLMLTVKPQYTMVTNKNLLILYSLVRRVNDMNLIGDIVECGVWNGGSAAVMGVAHAAHNENGIKRSIWLFDSFEGLPQATEKDGLAERQNYFKGWNKGDIRKVEQVFAKLRVPLKEVKIISGWFHETLRRATVKQIAILHVDADWYESVKLALGTFYDKVVPGGFVILNDYNTWEGCNHALNDFLTERHLSNIAITEVEPTTGAYFQKPPE